MVLVNSNPATIMTDPGTADRTYVGPMTPELVEQILEKVRRRGRRVQGRWSLAGHCGTWLLDGGKVAEQVLTEVAGGQADTHERARLLSRSLPPSRAARSAPPRRSGPTPSCPPWAARPA